MNRIYRPARQQILGQILALLLCSAGINDAQAAAHFDPRNHDDLNQVIMLCATEPASERFAATWQHWVQENPEADVYAAVDAVISRAGTFRGMAIPGMEPVRHGQRPDPAALTDYMLSLVGKRPRSG